MEFCPEFSRICKVVEIKALINCPGGGNDEVDKTRRLTLMCGCYR